MRRFTPFLVTFSILAGLITAGFFVLPYEGNYLARAGSALEDMRAYFGSRTYDETPSPISVPIITLDTRSFGSEIDSTERDMLASHLLEIEARGYRTLRESEFDAFKKGTYELSSPSVFLVFITLDNSTHTVVADILASRSMNGAVTFHPLFDEYDAPSQSFLESSHADHVLFITEDTPRESLATHRARFFALTGNNIYSLVVSEGISLTSPDSVFDTVINLGASPDVYTSVYTGDGTFLPSFLVNPSESPREIYEDIVKRTSIDIPFTGDPKTAVWIDDTTRVVLEGTKHWKNYFFVAALTEMPYINIPLYVYTHGGNNRLACVFNRGEVRLVETAEGFTRTIVERTHRTILPAGESVTLGVSLRGSTVDCYVGDESVLSSSFTYEALPQGGIGFEKDLLTYLDSFDVLPSDDIQEVLSSLPYYDVVPTYNQEGTASDAQSGSGAPDDGYVDVEGTWHPEEITSIDEEGEIVKVPFVLDLYYTDGTPRPYRSSEGWSLWEGLYGVSTVDDRDYLTIGAPLGGDTASFAYLKGSQGFEDITMTTLLDWNKSTAVALVARFADYDNYVACSYSRRGAFTYIQQRHNGEFKTVASSPQREIPAQNDWEDRELQIRTYGNTIECYSDGDFVLRTTVDTMPERGGLGIQTWTEHNIGTRISVKDIVVEPFVP